MKKVVITSNLEGQRLEKVLKKCLPDAPLSFLYKMLRKKNITYNGKKADGKEITAKGDEICFFLSDETYDNFSRSLKSINHEVASYEKAFKKWKNIMIVYEDEDVLFLNKPAGILSQKADAFDCSINEWMIGYLLNQGKITEESLKTFKPSVCNRLDRNTSGLILCGISLAGSQMLSSCIKERSIHKFYRTFVYGKIDQPGQLKGYLKKDEKQNKVRILKQQQSGTSYIETLYKPIELYNDYSYIEVELITGKTHQIRAHFDSIGHTLVGERKYNTSLKRKTFETEMGITCQLLHAYRVEFPQLDHFPNISEKTFIASEPELYKRLRDVKTNEVG